LFFSAAAVPAAPITSSDYKLDLRRGPVIGSARKIAMGGTAVGYAEHAEDLIDNPAGVAYRAVTSTRTFDWDIAAGQQNIVGDYDNSGRSVSSESNHRVWNGGGLLRAGGAGLGFQLTGEALDAQTGARSNQYHVINGFFGVGWLSQGRQWSYGVGLRTGELEIRPSGTSSSGDQLVDLRAYGANLGLQWRSADQRLRVGASYASGISSNNTAAAEERKSTTVEGLIVPKEAAAPDEFAVGLVRLWNNTPYFQRHPFRFALDARVADKLKNAVGMESIFTQQMQPSGEHVTLAVHSGIEFEMLPHMLRLRAGGYREPSRFAENPARDHATGGFELALFRFGERHDAAATLSYAFDVARHYSNNMIALGVWAF
jgi:hypothetical protein